MKKLLVSLFVFVLYNVNSCRIPETCSVKFSDTTIKLHDIQRLLNGKELECVSNFIKGDYERFSNDLNLCVNLGYSSAEEYENTTFEELQSKMRRLKVGHFCTEGLVVSTYFGMYGLMLSEIGGAENHLITPEVIINSKGRDFVSHCWPFFADTLPYEMLLLRTAYTYGNVALGNCGLKLVEKFLDFKTFYETWYDRLKELENRTEIERHTEMALFIDKWIEENKSSLLEQCKYETALEFADEVKRNKEIISVPSYDLKSKIFTREYEKNSSLRSLQYKYSISGFNKAWTKYAEKTLKKESWWIYGCDVFPYKHNDDLLAMAESLRKTIQNSGGNVHEDFINFKKAVDDGKLFEAIGYEYVGDVYDED